MRGSALLSRKTQRDSIPLPDLIRMLDKSKPTRVAGTAIFLTSHPELAPSSLMHNLKHNKVLHERVLIMSVQTEDTPRVPPSKRYEIEALPSNFTRVTLHYGYMESPRIPSALASLRKSGLKFDIMTTSFFLGRRTIKTSPNSGMPSWQDKLFVALSKQAGERDRLFCHPLRARRQNSGRRSRCEGGSRRSGHEGGRLGRGALVGRRGLHFPPDARGQLHPAFPPTSAGDAAGDQPPVSLILPIKMLDPGFERALSSAFIQAYPEIEVFVAATEADSPARDDRARAARTRRPLRTDRPIAGTAAPRARNSTCWPRRSISRRTTSS